MRILDVAQGSEEWLQARCGKVSASRIADMMARTKSGWGASRKNYAAQLVVERLTGKPTETYQNDAMRWGTEHEAEAAAMYTFVRDVDIEEVGLVLHPHIEQAIASPDRLVGGAGLAEIKCPNSATHIETLLNEQVPSKYIMQMQWQLACTGRDWCDYVSFDPRVPPEMQIWITQIDRDDGLITELERQVELFLEEIDQTVRDLRSKFDIAEAA